MTSMLHSSLTLRRPLSLLVVLFIAWKALLLLFVFCSPGPGYDTSTSLLYQPVSSHNVEESPAALQGLILKMVRWDAIYFTQLSHRGHVYEQEWAFGLGMSGVVSFFSRVISVYSPLDEFSTGILVAIAVSHIAHWMSVMTVFGIVAIVRGETPDKGLPVAFASAALHIISPAGIFLSAPYSESLFSFLNIFGFFLYAVALRYYRKGSDLKGGLTLVISGFVFGFATTIRSNGILSGLLFLQDTILTGIITLRNRLPHRSIMKLIALVAGGLLIAGGFTIPQYIAYKEYCGQREGHLRVWCEAALPSIYTWVQRRYWDVGLFRYWTLSNLPLFLLALPSLLLLSYSAIAIWGRSGSTPSSNNLVPAQNAAGIFEQQCLTRFAAPQALLAVLALTSYHVQIINRLASGYFVWNIWLAEGITGSTRHGKVPDVVTGNEAIVRWMVVYGIIQAGLFSSFLPPA